MLTPIHNPAIGKLRVIGFASGSGDTLWKAYEQQKEMEKTPEGCPYEIVGVFCSKENSKAEATAKQLGVASVCIDINGFYAERGKPLKDREVRAEFDASALELIRPMNADAILLAGYVWATTDCILENYLVINIHPADLSIQSEDGKRLFAGGNGVGDALAANQDHLCSTSHLATRQIDGGPILIISERVPVDYTLHENPEDRMRHYLRFVNDQNRLVGARTLLEVANGNFSTDESGGIYYKEKPAPIGIRIENWEENKPIYQRRIDKLLYPESVAVIGASLKPGIGRCIIENIINGGFQGDKYVVNVRGEDVLGVKGYTSVGDIPGHVDLAVIATPGKTVLDIAGACGKKGVRAIVCISAGFKEIGGEGVAAQEKLIQIVDRYNMRMIGPNCMGEMNVKANLNATILDTPVVKGNIALVTQSGAIGASMLDHAEELGIGFSAIVSLGNQADITVCDLLPYYEQDEHTRVIALYLESIIDPVRFYNIASKMTKPILLLKSGSTSAGMAAASSHTGSLAGSDEVVNALINKAGIVRVGSLAELFMCSAALSRMPRVCGDRVALLTNAGGPGILIADALNNNGFDLPTPSPDLLAHLKEILMPEASAQNPVDVVAPAPPEHYSLAAKAMIESGEYDALLVCCIPPATVDTAKVAAALVPVLKESNIPVLTNFFGPTLGEGARKIMAENHLPISQYPEQMADMLAGMRMRSAFQSEPAARMPRTVITAAQKLLSGVESGEYLPVQDAYAILESFGIKAAKCVLARSVEEAKLADLSFPIVAKIEHPEIVHKSDVGGVRLNIADADEMIKVTGEFIQRFQGATGVLLQEMVHGSGAELIIGSVRDPQLGNALMVGLGGVWVELMKDVTFGYPPLAKSEAMAMIDSLRCEPLLAGYRGKPGVNKDTLVMLLQKVGVMLLELPQIAEIDLNPVLFDHVKNIFIAADVRIRKG